MADEENTNVPADANTPAAGNTGADESVNPPAAPVPPPMTEPDNYTSPPVQQVEPPMYPASTPLAPPPMPNYAAPPSPPTNSLAIISLVASILSWVLVPILGSIIGVVTGFMARNQIRESNGQQTGDGLALAGIIVGAINLVVACIGVLCFGAIVVAGVLSNGH